MANERQYDYQVIDVFTSVRFAGNQLAVFPNADGLSEQEMQSIAKEFNLSETVFFTTSESDALRRLHIFTPARRIRFAGHPTIGSAFVLIQSGSVPERFCLQLDVGRVPIEFDAAAQRIWLRTPPISFDRLYDAADCAAVLGLQRSDCYAPDAVPPQLVSAGNPNLYLCLRDAETVDRAELDTAAFRRLFADAPEPVCFFCFAPTPTGAYSRMFAPEHGVVEDPATGSATGPLAAYMIKHKLAPTAAGSQFFSEQGTKMGRRSILHVRVNGDEGSEGIDVGGWAVPVMKGVLQL